MSKPPTPLPRGRFGPTIRGGRVRTGGPDWLRLCLIGVSVVAVLTLAVGVSAAGVLLYGTQRIGTISVPNLAKQGDIDGDGVVDVEPGVDEEGAAEEIAQVLNVLVVGTDDRSGLTDDELLELGTDREEGGRTDTIMLIQLDPGSDRASLLSFPRDLLVERCDGSQGKINAAHSIGESGERGGPACVVQTVTTLTSIPIHHYVEVDLEGFIEVVDAIGGVTLYLDEPITDPFAGVDLDAGCVTMDGRTALGFVRIRKTDNDYGRIARQQRFLKEILDEASSVGTLINVPRLFALVEAAGSAVDTDPGLDLGKMRRIAFSLRGIGSGGLVTRTVPGETRRIDGAVYEIADEEQAEELFTAFRNGELPPAEVAPATEAPLDSDDVPPVLILNGAGISGLAAEGQERLEAAGFTVAETGNADSFGVAETNVTYSPEQLDEAEVLATAIGAALVRGEPGDDLTVVLGEDFDPVAVTTTSGDADAETDAESEPAREPTADNTDEATEGSSSEPSEIGTGERDPTDIDQYVGATAIEVDCG